MILDLTKVRYKSINHYEDERLLTIVLDLDDWILANDPYEVSQIATSEMVFNIAFIEVSYLFNQIILFAVYNSVEPRDT